MTAKFSLTQGSQLYFPDESASPALVVAAAQITGLTGLGGKKSKIDVTNLDSLGKEYAGGLIDAGEATFDLIWDWNNANHILVSKLSQMGTVNLPFFYGASDGVTLPTVSGTEALNTVELVPPKTTSPVKYSRSGFGFTGYFSSFVVDAKVDSVIMVHAAIQLSGTLTPYVKGAVAT